MIIKLSAKNFELTEELTKYATVKLEHMDRLVARKDRAEATVEAVFSQRGVAKTCQLTATIQGQKITVRESTQHFYASLDIAVVAVEQQLRNARKQRRQGIRRYIRPTHKP